MTAKTRAGLIAEADANLPDNTNEQISPQDVRELIKNVAESKYNILSDDASAIKFNYGAGSPQQYQHVDEALRAALDSGGGGFSAVALQVFTASGTYTPTAGMEYCLVISTGGGGGGGGADGTGASSNVAGGGGGAGATCIELLTAADIGASKAVTVGAAGTAGSDTGGNGGNGGASDLGSFHTANGGTGGDGVAADLGAGTAVAGGTASNGAVNIDGGEGGMGVVIDQEDYAMAGEGGASFWGGGANRVGGINTVSAGRAATSAAYGSGGGGATTGSTTGAAGGVGKAGIVVVLEFLGS